MNITQFSIDKKRILFTLMFVIFVTGLTTYMNMPRAEDPGFVIKNAVVLTYFPGASPERMEQLITDKLEKTIQEMPEIDNIMSQSKPGISIVYVNIQEKFRVMRPIWDNLRRKVEAARNELPAGIIGPFVNDEFGDVFGTQIAITGEGYSYADLKQIADECRNELLLIPEAAKVEITGTQEERVFIDFNNARLAELGISPGQLSQILESRNIIFPGGEIFTEDEQIILEPSGNFESVEELQRTLIKLPQRNSLIYLGDIAHIYRGYIDPPSVRVTHNGEPALVLGVSMREGGNIILLGEEIENKFKRFEAVYPIGVDFKIIYNQPFYVQQKIDEFTNSLIQAIAIVIAVMLIFLGIRTGLIISSLIPMSILMSIMVMGFFNIGLDQMTIAALIISLGLLVDNAIVMSESIMVGMTEGKKPVQSAIDSAKELRIPLLTSSLTTAAAFLPIYLAESSTGEYAGPIFKVVAITLICSWILSLTMTPLMCVLFLRVKKHGETYSGRFYHFYKNSLITLLKHPVLAVIGTFIIFYGSLQLGPYIPSIFFPQMISRSCMLNSVYRSVHPWPKLKR
jgi:multidrug efflux pump subunit AcrB